MLRVMPWDEGRYGEVAWHAGNAVSQVTSLKADAKLGLAKGKKVRRRGKVRVKQQRAAEQQGKRQGTKKAWGQKEKTTKVGEAAKLKNWRISTPNIGESAVKKPHHNWHKIFGNKKPNVEQIRPYVTKALSKGEWKDSGLIRGKKGTVIGTKVELVSRVGNNEIWVLGVRTVDGELIINNAGVK